MVLDFGSPLYLNAELAEHFDANYTWTIEQIRQA
jgi:hypothetical protein